MAFTIEERKQNQNFDETKEIDKELETSRLLSGAKAQKERENNTVRTK